MTEETFPREFDSAAASKWPKYGDGETEVIKSNSWLARRFPIGTSNPVIKDAGIRTSSGFRPLAFSGSLLSCLFLVAAINISQFDQVSVKQVTELGRRSWER